MGTTDYTQDHTMNRDISGYQTDLFFLKFSGVIAGLENSTDNVYLP